MKKLSRFVPLVLAIALLTLIVPATAMPAGPPLRVIVTFDGGVVNHGALAQIERRFGDVTVKELPMIGAAVVVLPDAPAERVVARLRGVRSVERDLVVTALAKGGGKPAPSQPVETTPWGVTRVHAPLVWPNTADTVTVGVIDTGIDGNHPDLAGNIKGGMSAVGYTTSWADDNGHGTHVSGIIAGIDNSIGVIGVAPKADLYAVKVLDRKGSGWLSDIIEGLQWSVDHDLDVVNMSLGTSSYSASFDQAVQATIAHGVVVVAAAGNDGPGANTVDYPGAFAGVIAVGATDSNDGIASFSSRGPQVALAAPGVYINSTYKGSIYKVLSGTSMASPHVAGVAALVLATAVPGGDASGAWEPAEVRARLITSADSLGLDVPNESYGSGLVDASAATAP